MPIDLENALIALFAKDAARRWQSMADLKVALEELREDARSSHPGSARPSPGVRAVRRFMPLALAGATAVTGIVAAAWLRRAPAPAEPSRRVPGCD